MEIIRTMEHLWLPEVFLCILYLAILVYAVLDGYDLGIGTLMFYAENEQQRDSMLATISPFWDANETWLVLIVGTLFIAFPYAYSLIMKSLYIPILLMILAIIMRGISFDFRMKVDIKHKKIWNILFHIGSLMTSFMQGFMLGMYIIGFRKPNSLDYGAAFLTGIFITFAYALIGASWLIIKSDNELQKKAIKWGRFTFFGFIILLALVFQQFCIETPNALIHDSLLGKPSFPFFSLLIIVIGICLLYSIYCSLFKLNLKNDKGLWYPFIFITAFFALGIITLGYLAFPYIIPGVITLSEQTADPYSLLTVLVGIIIVLPIIIIYSVYVHLVFKGKIKKVSY